MKATYARARLWTGILGVGTVVLLAGGLLASGAVERLFEGRGGTLLEDARWLAVAFAATAVLMLPFDLAGGVVLPRRHGRPAPALSGFLAAWLRGIGVLGAVWVVVGAVVLTAGRSGGRPAAVAAVAALALMLILIQEPLARLVAGLRRVAVHLPKAASRGAMRAVVLRGTDPGFTGGFAGLGGTLVVPERWVKDFEPRMLTVLLERRRRILRSGAWHASVALAVLWTSGGFALASLLPGAGVTTVAELFATALGFTLWTFLGLLLLPTPSRRATLAADRALADAPSTRESLRDAVARLDRMQDDEPERAAGVEGVFHPVPSVVNRLRALDGEGAYPRGAWHLARVALYLSWAGLSLLPRAVHCNAGRPELWAYLPSDG